MLPCRLITICSTAGFAASLSNMPGAKPNCLRIPARMPCAPEGTSSGLGADSRDTAGDPPGRLTGLFGPVGVNTTTKWTVKSSVWAGRWGAGQHGISAPQTLMDKGQAPRARIHAARGTRHAAELIYVKGVRATTNEVLLRAAGVSGSG